MRARWLSLPLLASVAIGVHSPAAAGDQKIGVVDLQHAVLQTEDGIRATATLKKLFDKRQQDIDAKQVELAAMRDDIEKQARILSRASLQRRMEDWQRRFVDLQKVFAEHSKELQKKQNDLTGPILKKMMAVISRTAKKNGYELILDRQAVPYVRSDLDLTEQVIQSYNAGEVDEPK